MKHIMLDCYGANERQLDEDIRKATEESEMLANKCIILDKLELFEQQGYDIMKTVEIKGFKERQLNDKIVNQHTQCQNPKYHHFSGEEWVRIFLTLSSKPITKQSLLEICNLIQ